MLALNLWFHARYTSASQRLYTEPYLLYIIKSLDTQVNWTPYMHIFVQDSLVFFLPTNTSGIFYNETEVMLSNTVKEFLKVCPCKYKNSLYFINNIHYFSTQLTYDLKISINYC